MLKIRLKRLGAKKNPTYRIIVINSTTKREGRPIQELGHYNPKTKVMKLDKATALDWISKGAQPTETVAYLIKNCNEDGTLNYVKKETVKLSKKALAKKQAEEEAAKAAAEAAAQEAEAAPAEEGIEQKMFRLLSYLKQCKKRGLNYKTSFFNIPVLKYYLAHQQDIPYHSSWHDILLLCHPQNHTKMEQVYQNI